MFKLWPGNFPARKQIAGRWKRKVQPLNEIGDLGVVKVPTLVQ